SCRGAVRHSEVQGIEDDIAAGLIKECRGVFKRRVIDDCALGAHLNLFEHRLLKSALAGAGVAYDQEMMVLAIAGNAQHVTIAAQEPFAKGPADARWEPD